MSGVFRNIDPPTPSPPEKCVRCGVRTHSLGGEGMGAIGGWGVNSSEDAGHCSVLYICVSTLCLAAYQISRVCYQERFIIEYQNDYN